jgi:hypothetical protein
LSENTEKTVSSQIYEEQKLYVGWGEKKGKPTVRQIKGVRLKYALSRYLLISFINVTMKDTKTANSLLKKLMELQFLDCYLQRRSTQFRCRQKTGQLGRYFKECSHKGNVKKS